ncbi:MAG: hypothetical protein LBG05_09635 [Treponema sp.]|jgi:hypothetical protein|nr:hypothetical protein [Treponema sp.]
MKIKTVFLFFNVIVTFFIAITGVVFFTTQDGSGDFWNQFLPLLIVLFTVLVILDVYCFLNGKLLSLMEKEDWPGTVQYLEEKVIKKGRYTPYFVSLLVQNYLLLADITAIVDLENKTTIANPRLIDRFALLFGIARVLQKDITGASNFFADRINARKPNKKDFQWVKFYYAFTMLLNWRFAEASKEFIVLSKISTNTVITGLSAWFLYDVLAKAMPGQREDVNNAAQEGIKRVKERIYDEQEWRNKAVSMQKNIYVAILAQYIQDAGKWIFSDSGDFTVKAD